MTLVPRRFIISISRGFNLRTRRSINIITYDNADNKDLRVASRSDEVQTSMNSQVALLCSLRLLLLTHVGLMLIIDKVDNGQPRITVVDIVTKSRRVNHSELDLKLFLLELSLNDVDLSQLIKLFVMTPGVAFGRRQLSGKERVDERCLSEARLA